MKKSLYVILSCLSIIISFEYCLPMMEMEVDGGLEDEGKDIAGALGYDQVPDLKKILADLEDAALSQAHEAPTISAFFASGVSYVIDPSVLAAKLAAQVSGNFHEVVPGRLYRSGQPTTKDLETYIIQYSIKTIINLRGRNPEAQWWVEEKKVADARGVELYNLAMDAHVLTPKEKLIQLFEIFDKAREPILIHCRAGSDRTGEAVALWLMDKAKKNNKEALAALIAWYGHNAWMFPKKRELIEHWQGRESLARRSIPVN